MTVIDVDEAGFQAEVLDRSATVPVVVDFWAAWCAPCRALGPLLEQQAAAREGDVVLAKVDTEANPAVSQRFAIQSIPAVKAFTGGEVVAEFVGAQGPAAVKAFFDALVPSEADRLAAAGDEASLRRALDLDPGHRDARIALALLAYRGGDSAEALELAREVTGSLQADGLVARIELEQDGEPDLAAAFAALDGGETKRGLDLLLDALPAADGRTDELRRVIVAVLDELGVEHPLAREARRRLAAALY